MTDVAEKENEGQDEQSSADAFPWAVPDGAVVFQLERQTPEGTFERCEVYDPRTKTWSARIALPFSTEDILETWGSGRYQVQYFAATGRSKGRSQRVVHLDSKDHPPMPRQYRPAEAPERHKAPAPPVAVANAPAPAQPPGALPMLPPELAHGPNALAMFLYLQQVAEQQSERRIAQAREDDARAREAEQRRFEQQMRENEQRHRREIEHFQAIAKTTGGDHELHELRRELRDLRDDVGEGKGGGGDTMEIVKALIPAVLETLAKSGALPPPRAQ